jgi:hypothetical protein
MAPDVLMLIVSDARLTAEAVRVILHVALAGEGEQHVGNVELSILVGGGEKPIRKAIALAEHCGYLVAERGGRVGHKLTFVAPESRPPGSHSDSEKTPVGEGFYGKDSPGGVIPAPVEEVDDEEVPPCSSPMLDDRTEAAFDRFANQLSGCRGALRDYLSATVPTPTRRYSYVNTVVSWLDGADQSVWRLPDGSSLPATERPRLLAAALNEMAAGDERKMKRPVGDPGNLKTKINILLQQRSRTNERTDRKPRAGGGGDNSVGSSSGANKYARITIFPRDDAAGAA